MASLFQRTLKSGNVSPVWWVKYSAGGRVIRESSGTTDKRAAKRFLDSRVGRVAEGQPILPRADRVRYDEAAEGAPPRRPRPAGRDRLRSEATRGGGE
jgi:hypothetical protein